VPLRNDPLGKFRRVSAGKYWFCLTHHVVEIEDGCPNEERLGPYDTAEEASRALEKVQERNEAWDHESASEDESSRD
jgi:hypothetical protein